MYTIPVTRTADSLVDGGFVAVSKARDDDEFRRDIVRFAERLGFQTVSATVVVEHPKGETRFRTVDNTPRKYRAIYDDFALNRLDPVMQHCKVSSTPIVWDQETYVRAGQAEKWEVQAAFGYRNGIAVVLHLPKGRHFMIGVDRSEPIPSDLREATRLVAELQLFSVYAHGSAIKLADRSANGERLPELSPREREVLRCAMDGMTARRIGSLLRISERTAALHLMRATRKLGCLNKTHAVAKAIGLGIVE